jgi:hypothetical protein
MTSRIDDHSEFPLPPRLADGLGRLYPPGPPVPPSVEGEILARARSHFARRRRLNLILAWAGTASAAAAVLVLALLLRRNPQTAQIKDRPQPAMTVLAREDIDHNGRVDILDAFALARRVENGQAVGASFDLNGDGRTGQADVDMIALAAVKLERGSLQ